MKNILYLSRNQNCAVALNLNISLCLKIDGSWFLAYRLRSRLRRSANENNSVVSPFHLSTERKPCLVSSRRRVQRRPDNKQGDKETVTTVLIDSLDVIEQLLFKNGTRKYLFVGQKGTNWHFCPIVRRSVQGQNSSVPFWNRGQSVLSLGHNVE